VCQREQEVQREKAQLRSGEVGNDLIQELERTATAERRRSMKKVEDREYELAQKEARLEGLQEQLEKQRRETALREEQVAQRRSEDAKRTRELREREARAVEVEQALQERERRQADIDQRLRAQDELLSRREKDVDQKEDQFRSFRHHLDLGSVAIGSGAERAQAEDFQNARFVRQSRKSAPAGGTGGNRRARCKLQARKRIGDSSDRCSLPFGGEDFLVPSQSLPSSPGGAEGGSSGEYATPGASPRKKREHADMVDGGHGKEQSSSGFAARFLVPVASVFNLPFGTSGRLYEE